MNCLQLFNLLSEMTVEERLKTVVALASDAEGNDFSPLHEAENYTPGAGPELTKGGSKDRAEYAKRPMLVLWPIS